MTNKQKIVLAVLASGKPYPAARGIYRILETLQQAGHIGAPYRAGQGWKADVTEQGRAELAKAEQKGG